MLSTQQWCKLCSLPERVHSVDGKAFEGESNDRQHIIIKWHSADVVSSLGIQREEILEELDTVRNHQGGGN